MAQMNVEILLCVTDLDCVKINIIKLTGYIFFNLSKQICLRTCTTWYTDKRPVFRMTRSKSRMSSTIFSAKQYLPSWELSDKCNVPVYVRFLEHTQEPETTQKYKEPMVKGRFTL